MIRRLTQTMTGVAVILVLGVLLGGRAFAADSETFEPPKTTYYFSSSGILLTYNGVPKPDLMAGILNGKETAIVAEMAKMDAGHYLDTSITADLDTTGNMNFWDEDTNILYTKTTPTIVKMRQGETEYRIYIPPGVDGEGKPVNQAEISYAIKGIDKLKVKVKRGVLIGSMSYSYNIFRMVPSKQVPLSDILEPAKDETGKVLPYSQFKSSEVTMKYALDYFFSPIFGRVAPEEATKPGKDWFGSLDKIQITAGNGSNGKSSLVVDKEFIRFSQPNSPENEVVTTVSNASVANVRKVTGVKNSIASALDITNALTNFADALTGTQNGPKAPTYTVTGIPKNAVDATVRLTVPYLFVKDIDADKFKIDSKKGYKQVTNVRLLVSRSLVYTVDSSGKLKKLGDFPTYGVDAKNLVMYWIKDKDTFGVEKFYASVIPLVYKEVIASGPAGATKQFTGRRVVLNNSYSSRLSLNTENKDIFGVKDDTTGLSNVKVRNYAFDAAADAGKGVGHKALGASASSFTLQAGFSTTSELKGFTLFLNNTYANDPALAKWLATPEAKAATGVNADQVLASISSDLSVDQAKLTYEQWGRIAQIKGELDQSLGKKILSFFRVLAIIVGVIFLVLSVALGILYWLDVLLFIPIGFSTISIITFGRLYPVASRYEATLIPPSGSKVKYVTFLYIFIMATLCIVIGLLLIYLSPLIYLISYLYFKLREWMGL